MAERVNLIERKGFPYLVYEEEGDIKGYCYLNTWNARCAFKTSAEISIYIDKDERNKGIGRKLIKHMIENIDKEKIHVIIAGIALPNEQSVTLHERFGFVQVSHFKEVGYKFDECQVLGRWQLLL